ncbi:COX15/CtaA family protein [Candidatus Solirubrobacter pratensis]|uniref:COX15/CtaA family protein n=1 Tax=Candidatus Solirubrobacter pratensis TaxID=1298857 RepID=UPI00041BE13C|nr:COX15/CtaA family protein [Candidatus Solirubrobacter pratensis]
MRRLSRTFTPREYRYVAYAALAVCTLIVFTGAAVRLTGSGLGCPEWPRCEGTRLTPELRLHGIIEFSNRVMTSVVAIPCVAAAILAWRRRPFRRDLALIALALPLGVVGQAVMGGLTVLYGLAPGWVIGHFLLSMALLVAAVALAWRATFEPGERRLASDRVTTWAVRALLVPGAITLALGTIATAAGPHAGGEGTGDIVPRLRWRGADTLDWAIHQHGALATLLGLSAVGVWFLARARRADDQTRNALTAVCVLLACQGFVGATQYALKLPGEIVWFHVVLAATTWISLLWATAAAGRLAPRRAGAPAPAAGELIRSP